MKTLIVSLSDKYNYCGNEKFRDKMKFTIVSDFNDIEKFYSTHDKIVIIFGEQFTVSPLIFINQNKHLAKSMYVIIDACDVDEDVEEYMEEITQLLSEFMDVYMASDREDLERFIIEKII